MKNEITFPHYETITILNLYSDGVQHFKLYESAIFFLGEDQPPRRKRMIAIL